MMGEERQSLYEGMYIISSRLSEDARQKALDKIQQGITERGGEVIKVHDLRRKRMAYEIKGNREGHYYVLYFKTDPAAISDMWKDYHLNEDLIRFLTLRAEEVKEKIEFKAIAEAQQ
ncbi:MAG: 30S ribosomal protein S6 [Waddliaceae bacterium]